MSALRALLDSSASEREQQTDELLTMAMRCADKRVVLKRPANSQPLISADGRLKPQGEVTSGKTRFDIYITRSTGQR